MGPPPSKLEVDTNASLKLTLTTSSNKLTPTVTDKLMRKNSELPSKITSKIMIFMYPRKTSKNSVKPLPLLLEKTTLSTQLNSTSLPTKLLTTFTQNIALHELIFECHSFI